MDSDFKLDFFPKKETIIFCVAAVCSIVISYLIGLAVWILIPIIALEYLVILGGAAIVDIEDNVLTVTSLNPFLGSYSVDIKSITKIKALDTIERKSDVDFGGYFLLFSRRCLIVYLDDERQKHHAYFSILSKKEEKRILKALRKLTKKEKIDNAEEVREEEEDEGVE
ncbi:hypothetical protein BH10BAC4_BH10BAC4_19300 [soil metagenome]